MATSDFSEVTSTVPEKSLLVPLKSRAAGTRMVESQYGAAVVVKNAITG